jgi:hypothetical protein
MGVGFSCSSKGALLIVAAVNGDIAAAHEVNSWFLPENCAPAH